MALELELGWAALVLLFAASLLTVSGWLLQCGRGAWAGRAAPGAAVRGCLRRLRLGLGLRAAPGHDAAGARALLAALFAFRAFRHSWQRAWLRALNEQACRRGVRRRGRGAPRGPRPRPQGEGPAGAGGRQRVRSK